MTKLNSLAAFVGLTALSSTASAFTVCNGATDTDRTDVEVSRSLFNDNLRLGGDLCGNIWRGVMETQLFLGADNWHGRGREIGCTFTAEGVARSGVFIPIPPTDQSTIEPFDIYPSFAQDPYITNPYAKIIAAGYLAWNGVSFGWGGGPILFPSYRAFHGPVDYQNLVQGWGTRTWHGYFRNYQANAYDLLGAFQPRGDTDRVYTYCSVYDASAGNPYRSWATTPSRASTLLHEAWHAVFTHQGTVLKSAKCLGHFCGGCPSGYCDHFAYHAKNTPEGLLYTMVRNHPELDRPVIMPYQLQNEFLCDVADNPAPWVPAVVRYIARNSANTIARKNFDNGIGWLCGSAAPAGGGPPTVSECVAKGGAGPTCATAADCAGIGQCQAGCCMCSTVGCQTGAACAQLGYDYCASGCCQYFVY